MYCADFFNKDDVRSSANVLISIFAGEDIGMEKKYSQREEKIALYAKAMGHPARVAILKFLASRSCCFFGDIHEVLPIAKATVSQHLSQLKDAGLIQGEIQLPKVRYCINAKNWSEAQKLFIDFMSEIDLKTE